MTPPDATLSDGAFCALWEKMVVSKADALIEMVRAFEKNERKRSNQTGRLISKSINQDKELGYSRYIQLDRKTKQLFPRKIRKAEEARR